MSAAIALAVAQLSFRGWLCLRGWFVGDDFAFIGHANTMPLWSHEYLIKDYNSHFMPGAFLLVRGFNDLWPMNFVPVAIMSIVLMAAIDAVVFALLRELFTLRPAIVLPFAVFLFTPLTLPSFLWWAAALNQLPQQLAMASAFLLHARYLRTGRLRSGLGGVACVVGGLAFSEKTILVIPLLAGFTLLFCGDGGLLHRIRSELGNHLKVWLPYAVLGLAFLTYYVLAVPTPARAKPTVANLLPLGANVAGHAVFPALLGGPWTWLGINSNGAVANPNSALLWAVLLAVVALASITIARTRYAIRGWALGLAYLLVNVVLLGVSRASVVGALIGSEMRYSTDLALVLVVSISLTMLPLSTGLADPAAIRATGGQYLSIRDQVGNHELVMLAPRSWRSQLGVAAVCLLVASSVVSSLAFEKIWAHNDAKPYFAQVRHDLTKAHSQLTLADVQVPDQVVWTLVYPWNTTKELFAGLTPHPRFLALGQSTSALYVPDDSGALRAAAVTGSVNAPGPETGCGWRVTSAGRTIPLRTPTAAWTWTVRVGFLATHASRATVTAGRTTVDVSIKAGLNVVYFLSVGVVSGVRISGLATNTALCTDDIQVGAPVPIAGTHP